MGDKRQKLATTTIAFLMSVVVVPAGLAAFGLSWLIIFAASLFLTLCVWVWGFRPSAFFYVPALIASALFAGWAIEREALYKLTFQFCRNQTLEIISGEPRLKMYALGIRVFNENAYDLWARSDEQSVIVAEKAAKLPPPAPPIRVLKDTRQLLLYSVVDFKPSIPLAGIQEARIRYVIRYGRDPDELRKPLIISGKVIPIFLQNGDTRLDFVPDRDSDMPTNLIEICRIPEN